MYRFDAVGYHPFGRTRNKPPVDRLLDIVKRLQSEWYSGATRCRCWSDGIESTYRFVKIGARATFCWYFHLVFVVSFSLVFVTLLPSHIHRCQPVDAMLCEICLISIHSSFYTVPRSTALAQQTFSHTWIMQIAWVEGMAGGLYNIELLDVLLTLGNFMHALHDYITVTRYMRQRMQQTQMKENPLKAPTFRLEFARLIPLRESDVVSLFVFFFFLRAIDCCRDT